jgi:hypothetical protein
MPICDGSYDLFVCLQAEMSLLDEEVERLHDQVHNCAHLIKN